MTDHDELLARIDAWRFDPKRSDFDTWQLLSDLRAAVATRPQTGGIERIECSACHGAGYIITTTVAGSATPTQENDSE